MRRITLMLLLSILLGSFLLGCTPKPILVEDFAQQVDNRWWLEGDGYGRTLIANNKLVIEVNQPNTIQYATLREFIRSDLTVEVDATLQSGSANSSYGILFRMQEGGAFYRFEVTGNGSYAVQKRHLDGTWRHLGQAGSWLKSDAIRTGVGSTNRLKVAISGQTAVVSVNGLPLEQINNFDSEYGSGTIALSAGTFSQAGMQVLFDALVVTE